MIRIIRHGLPKTKVPKNIVLIGAGLAGLVAGSLLKEAGHGVRILEADHRAGGRVYTLRAPFSDGLYLNMGAMRIPESHFLVLEYVRKFGLPLQPFVNETPEDILYVNGTKARLKSYLSNPDVLRYPVAPREKGKTAQQLLDMAVLPILHYIRQDPVRNWPRVVKAYDRYSMHAFLKYGSAYSDGAIEMIGVLLGIEGFMEESFLDIWRFLMPLQGRRFYQIAGGNDLLPRAFLPKLREDILFRHRATRIIQHSHGVTIRADREGTSNALDVTGDLAIVTVPFTVLKRMEIEPRDSFSHLKRKAIRELHYILDTKIGIEFKSRFWERGGQTGGRTVTDLPIRFAYYPSDGIGTQGPAVILASYTLGDDAMTWDGLSSEDRVRYALRNLAVIHGDQVYREFIRGASFSWSQNPYSCGDWVIFKPGQETELFPCLAAPEGRVHFAGEHTTLTHGWMQGAIESGLRVAVEVNDAPKKG
ncbi:NAD(P)-binding protein [Cohnella sp. CFH 77786]|uniref:flavin monoamine oxidase family protein n=1 Tax=Cohnella sp. CFH 77786 TaxID=2662265 RepID=UPI001C60946D|nr:flavin monoamine oxidase family protein [Cohnella sp. CFH 77786]MBW5447811.1 NAD(P)-binding protein [Cohnella sp. CFH 77786]